MLPHKWHPSHQSKAYHEAILESHRPSEPRTCKLCGWMGSMDNVCTVCLDMVKTLLNRTYWLNLDAKERIRERLRRQEEGPIGFTQ